MRINLLFDVIKNYYYYRNQLLSLTKKISIVLFIFYKVGNTIGHMYYIYKAYYRTRSSKNNHFGVINVAKQSFFVVCTGTVPVQVNNISTIGHYDKEIFFIYG